MLKFESIVTLGLTGYFGMIERNKPQVKLDFLMALEIFKGHLCMPLQ